MHAEMLKHQDDDSSNHNRSDQVENDQEPDGHTTPTIILTSHVKRVTQASLGPWSDASRSVSLTG